MPTLCLVGQSAVRKPSSGEGVTNEYKSEKHHTSSSHADVRTSFDFHQVLRDDREPKNRPVSNNNIGRWALTRQSCGN